MPERVRNNVGAATAALDYDAELMLRVKDGDSASFPFCWKSIARR